MHFGTLAGIQIATQVISLVVTIFLAYFGWHYWEIGKGVPEKDIVLIFEELKLKVERS